MIAHLWSDCAGNHIAIPPEIPGFFFAFLGLAQAIFFHFVVCSFCWE